MGNGFQAQAAPNGYMDDETMHNRAHSGKWPERERNRARANVF